MENKLTFYEEMACYITNAKPEDLFTSSRKGAAVMARQWCMYYRNVVLKYSLQNSASRYGHRDHATALHSVKTVNNLRDTNKNYRESFDEFIGFCAVRRQKEDKRVLSDSYKNKAVESGYRFEVWESIRTMLDLIHLLHKFVDDYHDESEILNCIDNSQFALNDLRQLFKQNDTEGVVGSR